MRNLSMILKKVAMTSKLMGGDDTTAGINYLRSVPAQDLANNAPCIK